LHQPAFPELFVAPAAVVVDPDGHGTHVLEVAVRKEPTGHTTAGPEPPARVPHAQTLSRRYVPVAANVDDTPVTPAGAKTAQQAFGWLLALAGSRRVELVTKVDATVSVDVRLE
jgi:hypothetical protein